MMPFARRALSTCRASDRSQILTMGPLGAATVVVGGVGVALVLVISEPEPQPASASTSEQAIRAGIDLTAFTYPRSAMASSRRL